MGGKPFIIYAYVIKILLSSICSTAAAYYNSTYTVIFNY